MINTYLKYIWNYFFNRRHEFIRNARDLVTLTAPTAPGQTITLTLSGSETVVDFTGPINYDFTLNVLALGCEKGDKLYIEMYTSTNPQIVTASGALNFNACGAQIPPSLLTIQPEKIIVPFEFDGTTFYGLDYCAGGGASAPIDILYSDLYDKIVNSELTPGQKYKITDYRSTNYLNGWDLANSNPTPIDPSFDPREVYYGPIEPIIVEALSESELSPTAYSTVYVDDILQYQGYANKIGLTLYIQNGYTLPDSTLVSNFDLQWDPVANEVYFNMPSGYPALFGHFFYIYADFDGGNYQQDGVFEPLTPHLAIAQFPYSEDFVYPKTLSRLSISPDGTRIALIDLDYNDYQNYDSGTLYVETVYALADAYGCITRRNDTQRDISVPFDFRGIKYRRYQVDISSNTFYSNPVYVGIGDNPLIAGSYRPTTGDYLDVYTLANWGYEAYNVHISGNGSLDGSLWYCGNFENTVFMGTTYNVDISFSDFVSVLYQSYNSTIFQDCVNFQYIGPRFANNIINQITNSLIVGFFQNNILVNIQQSVFRGPKVSIGFSNNIGGNISKCNIINLFFNTFANILNSTAKDFIGNTITADITNCNFEDFNSNTISPTLPNTFRWNNFQTNVSSINFNSATYVYADYSCNILKDSTSDIRLIYHDGTTYVPAFPINS